MRNTNDRFTKEKILITLFDSSHALKNEIRKIIRKRSRLNWDFCKIASHGSYLSLYFRKEIFGADNVTFQA